MLLRRFHVGTHPVTKKRVAENNTIDSNYAHPEMSVEAISNCNLNSLADETAVLSNSLKDKVQSFFKS